MRIKIQMVTTVLLVFLSACEGLTEGDGYVFDAHTGQPLDSVHVKSFKKRGSHTEFVEEMYSDSSGYFHGEEYKQLLLESGLSLIEEFEDEGDNHITMRSIADKSHPFVPFVHE